MPITGKSYEKALRTIKDYKGRKPSELSPLEFAALVSARTLVEQYEKENP